MADPAGMVCTSGEYKGRRIEVCVDQAEYTNERRDQAATRFEELWAKFAKRPSGNVAGYVFNQMSDKVFPQSRAGFDGTNHPLVDVPGKAITLDDGRTLLGAQELCGLETVEINGKLYRKRLLTPDEWAAVASKFGEQDYSTRSGKLDEGVHCIADGTRVVGQAKGHYVEHGGKEVYDMNGNVYELTYDPATRRFFASGGSWRDGVITWHLRAVDRGEVSPSYRSNVVGLRCGVSPQDSPIEAK